MDTSIIAKVCHEANMVVCQYNGDFSQKSWNEAEPWQRDSAVKGVQFRLDNPSATPADQHQYWMDEKIADGWVYGEVKDAVAKTHPCLVPYNELPMEQQVKDHLFQGIVDSLKPFIKEPEVIEVIPTPVAEMTPAEIKFAANAEVPVDNGEPIVAEIASAHAEEMQAADTITADTLISAEAPAPEIKAEDMNLWGGEQASAPIVTEEVPAVVVEESAPAIEAPIEIPVTEEVLADNPELADAGVVVGEVITVEPKAIVEAPVIEPVVAPEPEPIIEDAAQIVEPVIEEVVFEPTPVVEEVVSESAPVVEEVVSDPAIEVIPEPVVEEPVAEVAPEITVAEEPAPAVEEAPAPATKGRKKATPVVEEPAPVAEEAAPVIEDVVIPEIPVIEEPAAPEAPTEPTV